MVNKYDWKKTALKGAIMLVYVIVCGTISVLTDNNAYMFLIPLLEAGRNFLKHKLE